MSGGTFENVPLRRGAITGAGAFLGGAALVFFFMQLAGGVLGALSSTAPIGTAAFGYSALHGWPALYDPSVVVLLLGLIPAVILLAAGYSAASQTSGTPGTGFERGTSVVVGYLAVTVLSIGYFFVRLQSMAGGAGSSGSLTSGTDFVGLGFLVLFTGILFPLLFGGLGGLIAEKRGY